MKKIIIIALAFVSSYLFANDVDVFKSAFAMDSVALKTEKAELLTYTGITETSLFDTLEVELLNGFNSNLKSGTWVEYMSWLAKALASSGNLKYETTLRKVLAESEHKKVRKYAKIALNSIDKYASWKPFLNKPVAHSFSDPMYKYYLNMLRSDNYELMAIGGKRLMWAKVYDPVLIDALADAIGKHYNLVPNDKESIDGFAWMIRALGNVGGGNSKYQILLANVASTAGNKKIRKFAAKYSKY